MSNLMSYLKKILPLFLICFSVMLFSQEKAISELSFTGNKKTKTRFLHYLTKVKEGESLDEEKIKLDVDRLKRLDGIAHASYTIKATDEGYKVAYDLVENFSIIPGLRTGQANDGSFSYRVSVFEFNGFGRNIIYGGFYSREVFDSFGIYLEHPYLITNKLGLGVNYQSLATQQPIYFPDNQVNYIYTLKGPEFTVFYEKDFNTRFEFGTRIYEEAYQIIEGDPENEGKEGFIEPIADKVSFRGQYEYIDLDIEYHQLKGFQNRFVAEYFTGDIDILQTEFILTNISSYYKRIGKKGNWASRLQLSYSNPIEDSYFAPIVIDNQLNIRGGGNTIARGTSSVAMNTEYRHTLIEKNWFVLQSNAFLDAAGLQAPGEELNTLFNSNHFNVYSGVGVRFVHKRIFNAVIRVDYGFKALGNGAGESSGLVFGIGQYF